MSMSNSITYVFYDSIHWRRKAFRWTRTASWEGKGCYFMIRTCLSRQAQKMPN